MSTVPIGGIMWWSGALVDCPADYQVCDGTNGTPDLRDRFVIGAGGAYAVDETGGSATVTIPAHAHAVDGDSQHIVDEFGSLGGLHGHHLDSLTDSTTAVDEMVHPYGGSPVPDTLWDGAAHEHIVRWSVFDPGPVIVTAPGDTGGTHDHHVSGTTDGVGDLVANKLPSWYALFYIQRLA